MHGSGSGGTPAVNHTYYSSILSLGSHINARVFIICHFNTTIIFNFSVNKDLFSIINEINTKFAKFKNLLHFTRCVMRIILLIHDFIFYILVLYRISSLWII